MGTDYTDAINNIGLEVDLKTDNAKAMQTKLMG
jgi:hypothetical protein